MNKRLPWESVRTVAVLSHGISAQRPEGEELGERQQNLRLGEPSKGERWDGGTAESRKVEHHYPHALKVQYQGSS